MSSEERELREALEAAQAALRKERDENVGLKARLTAVELRERELSFQLEALKQPAPFQPAKTEPLFGRRSDKPVQEPVHWWVLGLILASVAALNIFVIGSTRGIVSIVANVTALIAVIIFIAVRSFR